MKPKYYIFIKSDGYYGYKGASTYRHSLQNFSKDKTEFKEFSEIGAEKQVALICEDFNKHIDMSPSKNKGIAAQQFKMSIDIIRADSKRIDSYLDCMNCSVCSSSCDIRRKMID